MSAIEERLRGVFKRKRNADDQYMLENPIWHRARKSTCNSTDDGASSARSYSTNSTVDDNPGIGRLFDNYLYQRGGRKVERLIFWVRIRLPNVHPALISRILDDGYYGQHGFRSPTTSLSAAMDHLGGKPVLISVLQNLVRQTQ